MLGITFDPGDSGVKKKGSFHAEYLGSIKHK